MVHGKSRAEVAEKVARIADLLGSTRAAATTCSTAVAS